MNFWELSLPSYQLTEDANYVIDYNLVRYSFEIKIKQSAKQVLILIEDNLKETQNFKYEDFTILGYTSTDYLINSSIDLDEDIKVISTIIELFIDKLGYKKKDCICYGYKDKFYGALTVAGILKCKSLIYEPVINIDDDVKWKQSYNKCNDLPYTILCVNNNQDYINSQFIPFLSLLFQKNCDSSKIRINFTNYEINYCLDEYIEDCGKESCYDELSSLFYNSINDFYDRYSKDIIPPVKKYFSSLEITNVSNKILNGVMLTHPSLNGYEYGTIDSFDWNIQVERDATTFQVYLQGFVPFKILVDAYLISNDDKYICYFIKLLESWLIYAYDNEVNQINKYLWNDHSVSLRTETLCYFLYVINNKFQISDKLKYLLFDLLIVQGKWLADNKNYNFNHNHGIMQDRALLIVGYLLNNKDWIEIATERLISQEQNAFNSEHIHTENSSSYAFMVTGMFKEISSFLIKIKDLHSSYFNNIDTKMQEYLSWLVLPNNYVVQQGDSKYFKFDKNIKRNEHKIYPKSGLYFFEKQNDVEKVNRTYKFFKCGCSSLVHKHADDLSFILYSKGKEIFIDGGFSGYQRDKFRKYFTSAKAHNTIIVDNKSYVINKDLPQKVSFTNYYLGDDYDYIVAENKAYDGVNITRTFISIDDCTLISDVCCSNEVHTYSQLFHLGEDVSILDYSDNEVTIKINDDFYVKLVQFTNDTKLEIFNGENQDSEFGYVSRAINEIKNINTLKFNITNVDKATFKTGIFIIDKENKISMYNAKTIFDKKNILFDDNFVNINNHIYKFKRNTKVIFTIDTESTSYPNPPIRISGDLSDYGIKENFGVSLIMDIFEEYGMRAVFFINVYESYPIDEYMKKIIKEIHERGHEVALHLHNSNYQNFTNRQNITDYTYDEQCSIIKQGADYIESIIGEKPISFRGGAYRINDDTLKALEKNGFRYDSTSFYLEDRNELSSWKTVNQIRKYDNIIEVPVMRCFCKGLFKKLDIDLIDLQSMQDILLQAKGNNVEIVQIMFHSFSFLRKKANYENEKPLCHNANIDIYGGDIDKKNYLRNLLKFIKDNSLTVNTFKSLGDVNCNTIINSNIFYDTNPKSIEQAEIFKKYNIYDEKEDCIRHSKTFLYDFINDCSITYSINDNKLFGEMQTPKNDANYEYSFMLYKDKTIYNKQKQDYSSLKNFNFELAGELSIRFALKVYIKDLLSGEIVEKIFSFNKD